MEVIIMEMDAIIICQLSQIRDCQQMMAKVN